MRGSAKRGRNAKKNKISTPRSCAGFVASECTFVAAVVDPNVRLAQWGKGIDRFPIDGQNLTLQKYNNNGFTSRREAAVAGQSARFAESSGAPNPRREHRENVFKPGTFCLDDGVHSNLTRPAWGLTTSRPEEPGVMKSTSPVL